MVTLVPAVKSLLPVTVLDPPVAQCVPIFCVEKGREGAWIQSHSSALPARSRQAHQRETHSEPQKVPASRLPQRLVCTAVCPTV